MFETPRSLLRRLADDPAEDDWRHLVSLFEPFVARWLGRAGVPESDRADISQDVMAAVVKDVPSFRHSQRDGAFRKWLRTVVVVHRTRGYWRKRLTAPHAGGNEAVLAALEDPDSGLSGEWDREHDAHVTRQLLARIECEFEPTTWAAFRRQMDGAKASAVAAELGLTVNAALIAKSRVLRRLREESTGLLDDD